MTITAWVVLIVAALFTLVFSVAHYTLRNPSRSRLEEAFKGSRNERRLKYLDDNEEQLLLTTGALRTLAHLVILLGLMHANSDDPTNNSWSWQLARLAIAAGIVWIFGIAIPHAWSKYGGEKALKGTWPLLVSCDYITSPLARLLAIVDLPVKRLSGHDEKANGKNNELEQEILQLVSDGASEEGVDADELEMINSVIEFHDIRAAEIMTPRTDIEALPVEADLDRCKDFVINKGHSRIPVYEDTLDSVIGVLYAKDLLSVNGEGLADQAGEKFELSKTMRKAFYVPETKAISDLLKEFRLQSIHMAIVLDEYGGTAGLITIEDLIEEIVGDIADEYEEPDPEMLSKIDESTFEIDARMYVDDFNDELDVELPEEEDYDTIGGFVFSTLGYIPQTGEKFCHDGLEFTVIEAEQRKINSLRVIKLPEEESENSNKAESA